MNLKKQLHHQIKSVLSNEFGISSDSLEIQHTRKEFEGDYTLVVFPLIRDLKMKPEDAGSAIGNQLVESNIVEKFNVVKGFLNLTLPKENFLQLLNSPEEKIPSTQQLLMVEYSSPNTNKPLHLGHIRNNLLGYSVAQILTEAGNQVTKSQIINDRGIHICKSMLAWQKFGNGETPDSTGLKGDKLVGKYYVEFDKHYKKEIDQLVDQGVEEEAAKKQAPLLLEAQEMLIKWENKDASVRALWEKMNGWVYKGGRSERRCVPLSRRRGSLHGLPGRLCRTVRRACR